MNNYGVGTHRFIKLFDCYDCALKFYEELKDKKFLCEVGITNRPRKILLNTYGWKNE